MENRRVAIMQVVIFQKKEALIKAVFIANNRFLKSELP